MTMKRSDLVDRKRSLHPAFCFTEDWQPHLPEEFKHLTKAQWTARARDGRWAPYMKVLTQKSEPIWRRSDIFAFFQSEFSECWPDALKSLRAAGFEAAELSSDYPVSHGNGQRHNSWSKSALRASRNDV